MTVKPIVRRHQLPDFRFTCEIHYFGMEVTCRVIELKGRTEITREMYFTDKTKPKWNEMVQQFIRLATINYQLAEGSDLSKNVNKVGNI